MFGITRRVDPKGNRVLRKTRPVSFYPTSIVQEEEFDWYVDSVNGSDSNTGKSKDKAFQTIAQVETVWGAGQSVGLARGSEWREQLDVPGDGCTVMAYGSGAPPILNALNVITPGEWTKTGGYTNVYQCVITPLWFPGKSWLNVYVNSQYLTRQSSIANCDANPGSMYPSGSSGTITLYIHSTGSTDPRVDGKTYEYTHRQFGLDGYSRSYCKFIGIHTKSNLHEDGSLRGGPFSTVIGCLASYGNKHNLYVRRGSNLVDVTAQEAYYNLASATMFVLNDDSPSGETSVFLRCRCLMSAKQFGMNGFSGHRNVSGNFGTITYLDSYCENIHIGFAQSNATSLVISNCWVHNTTFGASLGILTTIDGFKCTGTLSRAVDFGSATVSVSNLDVDASLDNSLIIYSTGAGTITVTDSNVRGTSFIGPSRVVYGTNAGVSITLSRVVFGLGFASAIYLTSVPAFLSSDYNCFDTNSISFKLGAPTYSTVAAWVAGTGQDTNSIVGGCAP